MSFFETMLKVGGAVANSLVEKAKEQQARQVKLQSGRGHSGKEREANLGGKTLSEWERSWTPLGKLSDANLSHLSTTVGLYRALLHGKVMYVGRAVEYANGGLRKRLSDYTRSSDSARKHKSGQLMHAHASDLQIDVLPVGEDANAVAVTKKLEPYFIGKYGPKWNKLFL